MYVNRKMRHTETIPGMRGEGTKENDGRVNSSVIYLIYYDFCKCHNVSLAQQ
jgi:hypothetical protein